MRRKHDRVTDIQLKDFRLGNRQHPTGKGIFGHQLNTATQLARVRDSVIGIDMGADPIGGAIAQDGHRFINTRQRHPPDLRIELGDFLGKSLIDQFVVFRQQPARIRHGRLAVPVLFDALETFSFGQRNQPAAMTGGQKAGELDRRRQRFDFQRYRVDEIFPLHAVNQKQRTRGPMLVPVKNEVDAVICDELPSLSLAEMAARTDRASLSEQVLPSQPRFHLVKCPLGITQVVQPLLPVR